MSLKENSSSLNVISIYNSNANVVFISFYTTKSLLSMSSPGFETRIAPPISLSNNSAEVTTVKRISALSVGSPSRMTLSSTSNATAAAADTM